MVTAQTVSFGRFQPLMGQQTDSGNPQTLQRLVGFYEYGQSLDLLDELLQSSDQEQIAVYDKLLKSRSEFTIYTNLSRFRNGNANSFATIEVDGSENVKHGLAWAMALARLELFAMVSVYGSDQQRSNLRPPTQYERRAFRELLIDGMRTHVTALIGDDRYTAIRNRTPDSETIAYARRLSLVARFIQSVAVLFGRDLTVQQREQLSQWNETVQDQRTELLEKIRSYLARTKKQLVTDAELMSCMEDCANQLNSLGTALAR